MSAAPSRAAAPLAAYVLHRYDWSESSLILDLFTRGEGRIVVAAKGAKRPTSQWRGVLLPFQRLTVVTGRRRETTGEEGAGEVLPLRSAEWAGGAALPRDAALLAGFYLNELLIKLLARHDPHPLLFDAYAATLPALAAPRDAELETALRAFELLLLRETGLLPELGRETQTQRALLDSQSYALRAEAGLVPVDEGGIAAAGWRALQAVLGRGDADVVALQAAVAPWLAPLKTQLRQVLHYHLGTPMLRTRQLMIDLQAP
ncbi:DNA repair protein RecO [Caldimonas sp. KR1-144]|uniref:DNA repair protein RecO n=1 Tax=Caldimonas sp. KR1-144 TaxID=3400911 RepID=UPI003C0FB2D3